MTGRTSDRLAQSRMAINDFYRLDEEKAVKSFLAAFPVEDDAEEEIQKRAAQWIEKLRQSPSDRTLLEDFMQRYNLSTAEGVALMSIAEAFLRVPDTDMADKLIIDKITMAEWEHAAIEGEKLITTFSGWGLRLSESILSEKSGALGKMVQRMGLPLIRQAMAQAIKLLGGQFVCGRTIEEAVAHAADIRQEQDVFSFDMLGEGARTAEAAEGYFNSYKQAIDKVGYAKQSNDLYGNNGVSIKLSALHPRYEEAQRDQCLPVLIERVTELALMGKKHNLLLTLDAEEADRLELSLDILAAVLALPELAGYNGLGLAVQAYQKRSIAVLDYLIALAREHDKIIPVRLVKGAYWDSEIKRAQEKALSGYPVFTRKESTDLSYLVAADKMLRAHDAIYPAFATHNAFTLSAILTLAARYGNPAYEFQRLYGMGQQLYDAAYEAGQAMPRCRIYAPVGKHHDLLPYLVRRLLENGANTSFVHQLYESDTTITELVANPARKIRNVASIANTQIPLPVYLYGDRLNSVAPDLSDAADRKVLLDGVLSHKDVPEVKPVTEKSLEPMFAAAHKAFPIWRSRPVAERADILDNIADAYEQSRDALIALCVFEGKKTIPDAIAEWKEAIDFCRYYANVARQELAVVTDLPGPTGESNRLSLQGRGVFVCISPWNFPLAIFTGQVVAALVAGNAVMAKPAEQTPAIAQFAVKLMHQSGVPKDILSLVTGNGSTIGAACVAHPLCAGVVFTGSTETAWHIQSALAQKRGPIVPFIAETGGQNAMIVDSTALPEQVVDDVIRSAFHSAGQRCSALRVLFVQQEIADTILRMLTGAMQEIVVGEPHLLSTDIGPVIDNEAYGQLIAHIHELSDRRIAETPVPDFMANAVPPTVFRISSIQDLDKENFGPLLHVVSYQANELEKVVQSINKIGYGLTLGIHSRVESQVDRIIQMADVGNIYVNRSMIGAVVGVQPFGGMGLSGTGPKAGGPHYLLRFVTEKTVSINTTASGGNTTLATLSGNE